MRIAFITHNYPLSSKERGNAGIFVSDMAREFAERGHNIQVFVVNASVTKTTVCLDGRLKIHFLGKGSLRKSLGEVKFYDIFDLIRLCILFIQSKNDIEAIVKKNPVDLCLAFWAIPAGILAYQIKKSLKVPYGIWALGSDIYVYQKLPIVGYLIKKSVDNSNFLLADGIDLANKITKFSNKICAFLPSATSFGNIKKIKVSIDERLVNFIFLGRLEKVKGPDILLSSLAMLPKEINYHVYFLGGGVLLERLIQKSVEYGLREKVSFLGNVDDKNIIFSYLAKSDLLVIPSRSDSIPLTLTEGAKAGIPVIVSDAGDMHFLVKKYKIGYTFPAGDIKNLSATLEAFIKNGKNKRKSFENNLNVFAKDFNVSQIASNLIKNIELSKN
ncbi:MAG: glycosyltransferase [Candidatus Levybacteria bacterium]|nr:glycosyltransferase [Candidatus Levybacteria bacterium]